MTRFSFEAGRCFDCADDAEHAIEVFASHYPPGYSYEIMEVRTRLKGVPRRYRVKAWARDGSFAGFCCPPEGYWP
jgi:hypothetical protein